MKCYNYKVIFRFIYIKFIYESCTALVLALNQKVHTHNMQNPRFNLQNQR